MTRPIIWTIGGYRVDVLTLVDPGQTATLSGDRLESGANYIDHVEQNSDTLRIEGVVSDFPSGELVDVRNAEREGGSQGSYRASVFARERLTALKQEGLPIDVVTPDRVFTSYIITDVRAPLHPFECRFSLQLEEARLVTLARELVRVPTAARKRNLGLDPFSKLALGLKNAAGEVLKDMAGNPVQIYDRNGKMSAWYSPTLKQWFARDGRAVDPLNNEDDRFRAKAGDSPTYDPKTKQLLTPEGLPVTKTPASGKLTPIEQTKQRARSSAPADTINGKLLRSVNPWWKNEEGAV